MGRSPSGKPGGKSSDVAGGATRNASRGGPSANASERTRTPAASIFTPAVDFLFAGGLSLIVLLPLLLTGNTDQLLIGAGTQAWIATAINMPHFMASYRIVYRDRASILRHKWATIFVPALLLVWMALAIWETKASDLPILGTILVSVSSVYLAWHYTGQTWGMMASFTYLAGHSYDVIERRLIRSGLWMLIAWHVSWWAITTFRDTSGVRPLYVVSSIGTVVAFVLGAIGIARFRRRTGALPPMRALVAWMAIFVWYATMARGGLAALFWVQIAHAVQYLSFPVRVEINRTINQEISQTVNRTREQSVHHTGRLALHMALYGVALLAASFLVAQIVPGKAMDLLATFYGEKPGNAAAPIMILTFINIHHYFTDGVIWKLRNPEVRRDLFAHVPKAPARA